MLHPRQRQQRRFSLDTGERESARSAEACGVEHRAADVYRFVTQRVANPADAADIAQQTLFLGCLKIGTFRGENLSGWLMTIANHVIIDYYRRRKRLLCVEVGRAALTESEPALRTPPDSDLPVCACGEGLRGWLDCISTRLSLEEQVAVLLADLYGYRDKDSAARLVMSIPSFKLLLHGARARLDNDGGPCSLVRRTGGVASSVPAGRRRSAHRVRAACRLTEPSLAALRADLLQALD